MKAVLRCVASKREREVSEMGGGRARERERERLPEVFE